MKLKLLFILLLAVTLGYSQDITVLNITELNDDLRLGQNCSNSQTPEEFFINNSLDLKDYEIELRNSSLIINGDLYSSDDDGEIEGCGNSTLCVTGNILGDIEIEDVSVDCSTLSTTTYELNDFKYSYNSQTKYLTLPESVVRAELYDLLGKRVMVIDQSYVDLSALKNRVLIVKYTTNVSRGSFKLLR